jgi:hypothetical protein
MILMTMCAQLKPTRQIQSNVPRFVLVDNSFHPPPISTGSARQRTLGYVPVDRHRAHPARATRTQGSCRWRIAASRWSVHVDITFECVCWREIRAPAPKPVCSPKQPMDNHRTCSIVEREQNTHPISSLPTVDLESFASFFAYSSSISALETRRGV